MKRFRFSTLPLALALACILLWASAAGAQTPPADTTYSGRLVDDLGAPLAGPVDIGLRIFDEATGGTLLYSEDHLAVALDPTGGFSVRLGLGSSPLGSYDADLFDGDPDRWLEVVVESDVLSPRQAIASVPWALVAERAQEAVSLVSDCPAGTDRAGAWCVGPTQAPMTWANAQQACWAQGMQLCPLKALMACDIMQPVGADCTATTDSPTAANWIWCSESHQDDNNVFSEGLVRIYAHNGNHASNEADWTDISQGQTFISHCCIGAVD